MPTTTLTLRYLVKTLPESLNAVGTWTLAYGSIVDPDLFPWIEGIMRIAKKYAFIDILVAMKETLTRFLVGLPEALCAILARLKRPTGDQGSHAQWCQ